MLSILKNTTSEVHVFLLTMDLQKWDRAHRPLTEKQADFLRDVVKEKNANNTLLLCDATEEFCREMQESVNLQNFYTPYCMLRLLADRIADIPDKVLYLDTDTVAFGDVQELFETDISGYEFAGAIDYLGKIFKHPRYINSGVLLLNLPYIRETGLFRRTLKCCRTKKMSFPDQDALNRMASKPLRIPSKYNAQRRKKDDTVIRHFCKSLRIFPYIHTVNVKPWETERLHSILKITYMDEMTKIYEKYRTIWSRGA